MTIEPGGKTLRLFVRPLATGLIAGLILALMAPYQTATIFNAPQRYAFWIWSSVVGALLLAACDGLAVALKREHGLPRLFWIAAGIVTAAVPVTLIVYASAPAINDGTQLLPFWSLFPSVLILCVPLQVVLILLDAKLTPVASQRQPSASPGPSSDQASDPLLSPPAGQALAPRSPLFDKIPARLGRDVLCMRTEDHYLRVYTAKGEALILMSLSDAEACLSPAQGRRVHRSWWVARTAVRTTTSDDKTLRLILTNGLSVPVSRSRATALREQGWLQDAEDLAP